MCISTNGTVPLFPNLNIVNNNNSYILRRGEENARRGGEEIASRGGGRRLLAEGGETASREGGGLSYNPCVAQLTPTCYQYFLLDFLDFII